MDTGSHHCRKSRLKNYLLSVLLICTTAFVSNTVGAALVPAFYYTFKTGSSSDYLPGYDITLSSDRYSFLRDFPTENTIDEIDWVSSPSYAKNYIVAYTTGGKIYQLRGWDSGSISFKEFDPVSLAAFSSGTTISGADLFSYTSVRDAFMNPGIIYWYNSEMDLFDNDSGMESYVIATGARTLLANNCTEYSAGDGELYCINVKDDLGQIDFNGRNLEINKIDAVSGAITDSLGSWGFPTAVSPGQWHFANANSMLYLARMNAGYTELWIFDLNAYLANPMSAAPTYITGWSAPLGADGLPTDFSDLRVSDDLVMIYHPVGKKAFIYNTVTGITDTYTTALQGQNRVHFMMQEAPVAPDTTDTTTTDPTTTDPTTSSGGSGGGIFTPIWILILCLAGFLRNRNKKI